MLVIREAETPDLARCLEVRPSYTTSATWQVVLEGDPTRRSTYARGEAFLPFQLRQTRLPRPCQLTLPAPAIPLAEAWPHYNLRLVALDLLDASGTSLLLGYLLLNLFFDQGQAQIARFLVAPESRGHGVGKALLTTARQWAQERGLIALLAHAPGRNVPGIEFYQQRGFRISGFLEHFYPTREDALFLMCQL